jgi:N-glycosidase YbiA
MEKICFYHENDKYFELSNLAPYGFTENGMEWPSVEHYILAQELSEELHEKMRTARSTHKAKLIYNANHHAVRNDWQEVREEVMLHALRLKFSAPAMQRKLLATEDAPLEYAAPYDKYWGGGRDGQGANRVGELMAKVRAELTVDA